MKTWRITYLDGTTEDVKGLGSRLRDGVLTITTSHATSYNAKSRSWPLTSIRSWEAL